MNNITGQRRNHSHRCELYVVPCTARWEATAWVT